jgi:1-deoxy-D-xylulose-5-phosphate synthase
VGLLNQIRSPTDVRNLPAADLPLLAAEIRDFLITSVSQTGGHLGPNLGVVELTIALHRVFDSPTDAILFDTGHQSYVHKLLTGRADRFETLRQRDGLSGYGNRNESVHDVIENSHASTALSYADGIAKAWQIRGELPGRHVVAVVGDGALTGGMAWEALNNIAAAADRPLVIVVNDNERSYSPTIGGLAHYLATLRATGGYEKFLTWGKRTLGRTPVVGGPVYEALHGLKKGLKDVVAPQGMFEDLGLKYLGPVDGHDVLEVERTLRLARAFPGPVIVHVLTEKGHGYGPAVANEADQFHSVGVIDPETGVPLAEAGRTWTAEFGSELLALGRERPDLVAITAAMLVPTGLDQFAQAFPDRTFDVGIAEQHAATAAAGLAFGGMHPVVAVYATFLNRAFDQVLMDVGLHRAGVTFVLDRAGVTGDDGPSHNGIWDIATLAVVPGLRLAAPRDGAQLRELLGEAVAVSDAPTVLRYPKGRLGDDIPAAARVGAVDLLRHASDAGESATGPQVLLIGAGAFALLALEVADGLAVQGIAATVVDPRWLLPVPSEIAGMAGAHDLVVTLEDGVRGGFGSAVATMLRDCGCTVPLRDFAVPREFLAQGTRGQVLAAAGLRAQDITRAILEVTTGANRSARDASYAER